MHMTREEAQGYKRALEAIDKKLSELIMLHSTTKKDVNQMFLDIHNDLVASMHRELSDINDLLEIIDANETTDIGAELNKILDA